VIYDEEKKLWKPSRRSFFFFGASAAVGAMLPGPSIVFASPLEQMMAMNRSLARHKSAALDATRWWEKQPYPYILLSSKRE